MCSNASQETGKNRGELEAKLDMHQNARVRKDETHSVICFSTSGPRIKLHKHEYKPQSCQKNKPHKPICPQVLQLYLVNSFKHNCFHCNYSDWNTVCHKKLCGSWKFNQNCGVKTLYTGIKNCHGNRLSCSFHHLYGNSCTSPAGVHDYRHCRVFWSTPGVRKLGNCVYSLSHWRAMLIESSWVKRFLSFV